MANDHDQRPECAAALAGLDAKFSSLLSTQQRQNGQLAIVADKLTEVRIEMGSKLSEIEADLRAFQQHSEDFENDIRSYRAEREMRERESHQEHPVPTSPTIEATLGIPLWKFLLLLVGLIVVLGAGIEGARWFMSRGAGIPTGSHVVTAPEPSRTPTPHPEHEP